MGSGSSMLLDTNMLDGTRTTPSSAFSPDNFIAVSPKTLKVESEKIMPKTQQKSRQRVKLSCDRCAQRKTKCPRQQPVCARCAKNGFECKYSSAQWYGKPKRPKKEEPEQIHTKEPSSADITINESHSEPDPFATAFNQFMYVSPRQDPGLAGEITEAITQVVPPSSYPSKTDTIAMNTSCIMDMPLAPQQELNSISTIPDYTESLNHWPPMAASIGGWDHASNPRSMPSDSTAAAAAAMQAAMQNLFPSHVPQSAIRGRDCFQRVCEAFQSLKQPQETATAFGAPATDYVGSMLQRTSHVIEEASSIMNCPCHTTATVRCALTMLLLEVVSWYESLGAQLRGGRQSEQSHASSAGSSCSSGSDISSRMFVPPVAVGMTMLSPSESAGVLADLMLSKIRKVRGMTQVLSTGSSPSSLQSEIVLDSVDESLEALKAEV